jgi:hypothetical protein
MLHSISGDAVFNFANGYDNVTAFGITSHIESSEAIMNLAMPLLYGALATGATVKFFS